MLNIHFGKHDKEIYETEVYFNNSYKKEWLSDPVVVKMIKVIDRSDVVDGNKIYNSVFGYFNPTELSGGVKTLILIAKQPKKIFNASTCDDNCAKYLLELAKDQDITVSLYHPMRFPGKFSVQVINKRPYQVISDAEEFLLLADRYLRGESK